MSINFGSLTTSSGVKLTFNDFDTDGDGVISEDELESAIKEYDLDSVELSTLDTNKDQELTEDEFEIWEQKIAMQEALQPYLTQVTTDFIGSNSSYASEMISALWAYLDTFAEEYTEAGSNQVSDMAELFAASLEAKYAELKEEILYDSPDAVAARQAEIKTAVLDDILDELVSNLKTRVTSNDFTDDAALIYKKAMGALLENAADTYISTYEGDDLETDLKAYLEEYAVTSDYEKLEDAITTFKSNTSGSSWDYIDSNELETLKEYAKELFAAAFDAGISITFGGSSYTSQASLEKKIDKYTDGDALMDAVNNFINSLSTTTIDQAQAESAISQAKLNEYNNFISITGSSYQVDASLIDYSSIEGYFDGGQIYERGKGWSGSYDKAYEAGQELLNNDSLKSQMKAQIESMLSEYGVSFEQIESVFENVYNSSIIETLESDGMITGRGARGLSKKGKAYIDIKTLVDTFIETFNTNISSTIDEMNASNTDMDLQDFDYSVMGEEYEEAYANGDTITIKDIGSANAAKAQAQAETAIDSLNAQILSKAKAMCDKNGVEFDLTVYNTMFNNAKSTALAAGIDVSVSGSGFIITTKSSVDVRTIVDTFTSEFKTNYTDWIDKQKNS